jgi:hypothetical protein
VAEYKNLQNKKADTLSIKPGPYKYPLPSFLKGVCTQKKYLKWLNHHSGSLRARDVQQSRPYVSQCTFGVYKQKIHDAVCSNGQYDPFTGDTLRWDQLGMYNTDKKKVSLFFSQVYSLNEKELYLLPTVDHIDPNSNELEFEICSWRINTCKSLFTPEEFVALCKQVTAFAEK